MNRNPNQLRIARMERECDVSCVPAVLLMAGCATLVLALALDDLQREPVAAQGAQEIKQNVALAI